MSQNATPDTQFALCQHFSQAVPMRFPINTMHNTSEMLRLLRKMTLDTSKVLRLPRKLQRMFWKRRKSIAPATQNDFEHVIKQVHMSRSATPATRNEATRHVKPPKMIAPVKLPIGTAIWSSHERLRTVANGWTTSSEHTSTPTPPEWNGNPCYAFGKKKKTTQKKSEPIKTHQKPYWKVNHLVIHIIQTHPSPSRLAHHSPPFCRHTLPRNDTQMLGFCSKKMWPCYMATNALLCSSGIMSDHICQNCRIIKYSHPLTRV